MATTTDWFPAWLARHLERHATAGLPDPATKFLFYDGWRDEFGRVGMTEPIAEEASRLMVGKSGYKSNHFATLCKLAWEARRAAGATSGVEEAKAASRDCRDCYGEGFASVKAVVVGLYEGRDVPTNQAAYCLCRYGRWLLGKARREAKKPTVFIDLAAVRNGESVRVAMLGQTVTLEFEPEVDHDGDDYIKFLPKALREKAEALRPKQETEAWA